MLLTPCSLLLNVLVPFFLLLAMSGCQEEYDMETDGLPGSLAAERAQGEYQGTWKLVQYDPAGKLSGEQEAPGSLSVTAGTTGPNLKGAPVDDNPNAATFLLKADELKLSFTECLNVALRGNDIVFFNKFDDLTQVKTAFAGSIQNAQHAITTFQVIKQKKQQIAGETQVLNYTYVYSFDGQRQ